jgi:tetratricopeptide (TPR) repeat protein
MALAQMTDPAQRKRAYQCRAAAHARANQLEAAMCDCEAGLALDPDDPALGRFRARLLVLLGRCEAAVQSLTSALELHRGDLDSLYLRAAAYAGCGNVAAARQDIVRACGLEAARRTADAGSCRPRVGHDLQAQMAVMWATLIARPGQRITAYGTAPPAEGEDTTGLAAALLNRAAVYLMLGQNEQRALSDLDEAARLEPTCTAVLMTRALVNAVLDRYDAAFKDAATAISGEPEDPDDDFIRAVARALRGDDLTAVLSYLDGAIEPQAKGA